MSTGRSPNLAAVLAATLVAVAGCAQPGPVRSYRTSLGAMKASLSHMEYENEQIHREVDKLKADNRDIENKLVQEESANGDLTARLNDARNLISRRGKGFDDRVQDADDLDEPAPIPARRSNSKRRKPPVAKIPGRIDAVAPAGPDDDSSSPRIRDEDLGPQSQNLDTERWLPVARGTSAPTPSKLR